MSSENPALTIYFDGSCLLCLAEVALYCNQAGANDSVSATCRKPSNRWSPTSREQMRWLASTFGGAMGSLFQVLQLSSAYGGSCHVGAGRLRLLRMEGHIAVLAERYGNLAKTTLAAIDTVNEAGDGDTADIFTAVSRFFDKALWFLEAHETNKA